MNKKRKKEIDTLNNILKEICSGLDKIKDDETDYLENMPENLQGGMRAYNSEDAIDKLETAIDLIQSAIDEIEEI